MRHSMDFDMRAPARIPILVQVVLLALIGAVEVAKAADYLLLDGKGYSLCETYVKNLNAFPKSHAPMVCDQRLHPTQPAFKYPLWKDLDLGSNLKLVHKFESEIWYFTRPGEVADPFDTWLPKFRARNAQDKVQPRLREAPVTMMSGSKDVLISYEPHPDSCNSERGAIRYGSEKYFFVRRGSRNGEIEGIGGISQSKHDVLLYNNRPIFISIGTTSLKNPSSPDAWARFWAISVGQVAKGFTPDGRYLAPIRCEIVTQAAVQALNP